MNKLLLLFMVPILFGYNDGPKKKKKKKSQDLKIEIKCPPGWRVEQLTKEDSVYLDSLTNGDWFNPKAKMKNDYSKKKQ